MDNADKEKGNKDKIELRSDKVRDILHTEPRVMLRWGTAVVFVIFIIIAAIISTTPFPHGEGECIGAHLIEYLLSALGGK